MKDEAVERATATDIVKVVGVSFVEILTPVVEYLERVEARMRVIEDVLGIERPKS